MAKKIETIYKNLSEVDDAFHELATFEYQKQRLESDKNLKVTSLDKIYSEELEPIAKEIAEITKNILDFAEANKADFETSKTKKLPNGTISCRTTSKVDIPDENKTLELIKRLNLNHCIKRSEGINKDVVKTLDAETLKKVKAEIITEQKFSIKTNHAEIKTVTTA